MHSECTIMILLIFLYATRLMHIISGKLTDIKLRLNRITIFVFIHWETLF